MMCTILRMSDSTHNIIMWCLFSRGQHHKRLRVTHAIQVAVSAMSAERPVLLQTVTHIVTVSRTALILPLIWLVIQWLCKHDLW